MLENCVPKDEAMNRPVDLDLRALGPAWSALRKASGNRIGPIRTRAQYETSSATSSRLTSPRMSKYPTPSPPPPAVLRGVGSATGCGLKVSGCRLLRATPFFLHG